MSELWQLTATELAARIASKRVSSTEVVEAHLRRIESVNPRVNAVVKVLGDRARRDAAEADRKVAAGEQLGPLHGVPFTIKENIDAAGCATTWGVPAYARNVATKNAVAVDRLLGAGVVLFGKTNVPLFLADWQSYNAIYGKIGRAHV